MLYHQKRQNIDRLLERYKDSSMVSVHQVDLLDSDKIGQTMKSIVESAPVDIFVHAVTLPIKNQNVVDMQWKEYQSHIDIQTRSFFQIVRSLIPSMTVKKRGKIISILTSATVGRPPSNMSDYIVAKYSLLGLSKSMAAELGHLGITVNCISPSMTNTPLIEKFPIKLKEIAASQAPLGRLAEPSDISSLVMFLCSNNADYISGENFLVAGGQTMH